MNCHKAQRELSARHDGALAPAREARLAAHVRDCPDCRAFEAHLAALTTAMQARPVPAARTPEAALADARRAIRLADDRGDAAAHPLLGWIGQHRLRTAAAAAVVVAASVGLVSTVSRLPAGNGRTPVPAEVLRVTTELAGASTMVYEDQGSGWTVVWVMPPQEETRAEP